MPDPRTPHRTHKETTTPRFRFVYTPCMVVTINVDHVERKLEEWRREMEERGLKISRNKTEYLGCNEHQDAYIHLQGETVKRVMTFTYLGSTLAEDGELDAEVTHRVQSGWKNWKRVSGVLCDRRMNVKSKGKVYSRALHGPEI